MSGVCYMGSIPASVSSTAETGAAAAPPSVSVAAETGKYKDGVYTGTADGYRGKIAVQVTVSGGNISDITVLSAADDGPYFSRASSGVIPAILSSQSINVSTVSGATFSSNSILEAVADALGLDFTNPNSSMSGGHGHGH